MNLKILCAGLDHIYLVFNQYFLAETHISRVQPILFIIIRMSIAYSRCSKSEISILIIIRIL